ncbi:hypothetical protein BpHYR1_039293, partial [Brachionus plicatilis]
MTRVPEKLIKKISSETLDRNECDLEWIYFNNKIFFKRNLLFYYQDVKVIRLFLIKHVDTNFTKEIEIYKISEHDDSSSAKSKIENQHIKYKQLFVGEKTAYGYIEIKDFIYSQNEKIKFLEIKSLSKLSHSEKVEPITKIFRNKKKPSKNLILCSKVYSFSNEIVTDFEWWFQINKLVGVDKIVFYNGSIGTGSVYHDLFKKYENYIEVVQMQCLPMMGFRNSNSTFGNYSYFYSFNFFSQQRYLYDLYSFNDCYLRYQNDYQNVLIADQDEVIIPRLNKHLDSGQFKGGKQFQ